MSAFPFRTTKIASMSARALRLTRIWRDPAAKPGVGTNTANITVVDPIVALTSIEAPDKLDFGDTRVDSAVTEVNDTEEKLSFVGGQGNHHFANEAAEHRACMRAHGSTGDADQASYGQSWRDAPVCLRHRMKRPIDLSRIEEDVAAKDAWIAI